MFFLLPTKAISKFFTVLSFIGMVHAQCCLPSQPEAPSQPVPSSQLEFEIVDLGMLESDYSRPISINDRGEVCGIFMFQGKKYCFLWRPEKEILFLNVPEGAVPVKINNQGQIIGQYHDGQRLHGFLWDSRQGCVDLGNLSASNIWVQDINDLGQVVGKSQVIIGETVETHGFLWENGTMLDLNTLSGDLGLMGNESCALSINNDGVIAGFATYALVHKGKKKESPRKAVIWRNGRVEELMPRDHTWSEALALNNHGEVIIRSQSGTTFLRNLRTHVDNALQYTVETSMRLKDTYAAVLFHDPIASNMNCSVLLDILDLDSHACIVNNGSFWTQVVCQADVNCSNWIIGTGKTMYGELHAILLRPRERISSATPERDKIASFNLNEILVKFGNNPDGLSPLHYAIKIGDKRVVALLLDHGADVNAKDGELIALHRAILSNQFEVMHLLVDRGADIQYVHHRYGNSAWGWSAIHYAAEIGNANMIKLLVKNGVNLDQNAMLLQDQCIEMPLHIAAKRGNFEAVIALVEAGASINAQTREQPNQRWQSGTPLDYAAHTLKFSDNAKNLDLVRFLVEHGAMRKCRDYDSSICPVINGYLLSVYK